MTQLFLIHSAAATAWADQLRDGLTAAGYAVWQLPAAITAEMASYPRELERGIQGSAAAVLLWDAAAAADAWVERQVLYAQRLQKPVVPICTDATALPITLVAVPLVQAGASAAEAVARLRPHLPAPDGDDLLAALLTHDYIRERKRGIAEASALLARGERREELLALLEDLARNDLYQTVRETAQAALGAFHQAAAPVRAASEARHMVGARCPKGHVSYFDRRVICVVDGTVQRSIVQRANKPLDHCIVKCKTCGEEMVIPVDCEGYRR